MKRPRVDVNLEELDRDLIERGTHAPLSESESEKLKERAACVGRNAAATTLYGKDQERFGAVRRTGA